MKRILAAMCAVSALFFSSCDNDLGHSSSSDFGAIYMIGASIAYPENTWFETGCGMLGAEAINRAVSGTMPVDSVIAMSTGQEYTLEELDRFGIFVIMHVHNLEVCDESKLLDDYNDYVIERNMDYSQAFDYIIRRYIDDCRALENNPKSKWYGVEGGKPVRIVLCTYWHDARVVYNESVRRLAERWKEYACLCEFDENIGFSKDDPDPDTGEQISLIYAQNGINDTEVIDGVTYGWHPTRGEDAEIQLRMAKIFADTLKDNYGL